MKKNDLWHWVAAAQKELKESKHPESRQRWEEHIARLKERIAREEAQETEYWNYIGKIGTAEKLK